MKWPRRVWAAYRGTAEDVKVRELGGATASMVFTGQPASHIEPNGTTPGAWRGHPARVRPNISEPAGRLLMRRYRSWRQSAGVVAGNGPDTARLNVTIAFVGGALDVRFGLLLVFAIGQFIHARQVTRDEIETTLMLMAITGALIPLDAPYVGVGTSLRRAAIDATVERRRHANPQPASLWAPCARLAAERAG